MKWTEKEQQSGEQETIMWHTAPRRRAHTGGEDERSSEIKTANQWWNSWGNINKNKKLLERLECVTISISIIDRVLNVYKAETSEPYKKVTKRLKHKRRKKYLRKRQRSKRDVDVETGILPSSGMRFSFSINLNIVRLEATRSPATLYDVTHCTRPSRQNKLSGPRSTPTTPLLPMQ